jgi:isopenicillin-N N-acyltransferase-like protein
MIKSFSSTVKNPVGRGREFGESNRDAVQKTASIYLDLFGAKANPPLDITEYALESHAAVSRYAPSLGAEIEGIAEGAALPLAHIAALNARTEILARADRVGRGECSTVVILGDRGDPPISLQTWDWHEELSDSWLVWTIEHEDGRTLHTLTEYGIVGKIGVNSSGVAVHLNILHHDADGQGVGIPVHVIARSILDSATNMTHAITRAAEATASASSSITVVTAERDESAAVSIEVNPIRTQLVNPNVAGRLIHTNHFLSPAMATGDREQVVGPDSFVRLGILERRLSRDDNLKEDSALEALSSHLGGGGAICCHPDPSAEFGSRYATLATVAFDVGESTMRVQQGGPCQFGGAWWSPAKGSQT